MSNAQCRTNVQRCTYSMHICPNTEEERVGKVRSIETERIKRKKCKKFKMDVHVAHYMRE